MFRRELPHFICILWTMNRLLKSLAKSASGVESMVPSPGLSGELCEGSLVSESRPVSGPSESEHDPCVICLNISSKKAFLS
jgi:hypothetical protein